MNTAIIPTPRCEISIRPATLADVPFIDSLQRVHSKMVGWMPTAQLEGKIKAGHVLIACRGEPCVRPDGEEGEHEVRPYGYVIGHDQYFKRDDVGIIYQLNVVPMKQRNLIGASLIKAMFDRAAYGCRLFCCWCAQDIDANYFWESLGFIPLAFRSGSRGKKRTHIFWQRRIREGDITTPYWFPAQTSAGSIREDRLVLPIPPGTHWKEVMPVVLPGERHEDTKALRHEGKKRSVTAATKPRKQMISMLGRLRFVQPQVAVEKPKKAPRQKVKNDPRHVAAARELRDRYLEQFNSGRIEMTSQGGQGKYEVARMIAAPAVHALPAAA